MSEKHWPMRLMIIEDEKYERERFLSYAETCPNKIKFVCSTSSSLIGLDAMRERRPDGVILDLELHDGEGSGRNFLEGLKKGHPDGNPYTEYKPIIIVVTNTKSSVVYNSMRDLGVDYIHYKRQSSYSVKGVIDDMLMFHSPNVDTSVMEDIIEENDARNAIMEGCLNDMSMIDDTTPKITAINEDIEEFTVPNDIINLIDYELDAIGMGRNYKGRANLTRAIGMMVVKGSDFADAVLNRVAAENGVAHSTITRNMQTAIENTWKDSDPEILEKSYTIHISKKKRNPNHSEFMHFFADKVRKKINA